ncbi:hypothetical protein AAG570_005514 [Ranatra chinensis]|uniref:Oxidoreductase-like domain-containing protein n=1 Tax=Ranatra chinensis TaxID=642074 RepID=A0ABD0XXM8_9HEMI
MAVLCQRSHIIGITTFRTCRGNFSSSESTSPTFVDSNIISKGKLDNSIELPEEPTDCCMSGCANCVWIDYAEELMELFKDGGEKYKKIITEKVKDPNMQAFLLTELKKMQK